MAIARGCEAEVLIVVGGVQVEIESLRSFGMAASTSTESIAVLNNNCVNKNSITSKEVTGSAEACWDCADPGQQAWRCGETVEIYWYPKGQNYVPENGEPVPLWHGNITISSWDLTSNADDAVQNWTSDFVLESEISSNIPL